jgi:hypothetical protein
VIADPNALTRLVKRAPRVLARTFSELYRAGTGAGLIVIGSQGMGWPKASVS